MNIIVEHKHDGFIMTLVPSNSIPKIKPAVPYPMTTIEYEVSG